MLHVKIFNPGYPDMNIPEWFDEWFEYMYWSDYIWEEILVWMMCLSEGVNVFDRDYKWNRKIICIELYWVEYKYDKLCGNIVVQMDLSYSFLDFYMVK